MDNVNIITQAILEYDLKQVYQTIDRLQKTVDQNSIKIKLDVDKNIQSQMSGIQKQLEGYQKTASGLLVPKSINTEPIKQVTNAYKQQADAISQVTNVYNNYATSTSNVNNVTQSYASNINNVSNVTSSYTSNINQANTAINSYAANTYNAEKRNYSYANSLGRIISQYISLYAAIRYLKSGFSTLKEMDEQLVELSKVTNITRSDFHALGLEALEVASKYGVAVADLLAAQVAFGRAGYENVEQMGELATIAISAGQLTQELASSFMVAADKAYKFDGSIEKLSDHIDSLNQVSNRNAVDFEFLAEATERSANVMTLAGETAQQQVAIWTTMGTVTQRTGSEVGRAARTIELRLQQVKQAFEGLDIEIDIDGETEIINAEDMSNAAKALSEVGIEIIKIEDGVEKFSTLSEVAIELRQALDEGRISATEMSKIVDAL